MNFFDLLTGILKPIEPYLPYLIAALIGAIILAIIGRLTITATIRTIHRWRLKLDKNLYKELTSLLSNQKIVETYAPTQRYIEEQNTEEGEPKKRTNAWLSPHPRAVKAAAKRTRNTSTRYFNARQQIKDAEQRITIRHLNEIEQKELGGHYDPDNQFMITYQLDGLAKEDILKLEHSTASQLRLHEIQHQTQLTEPGQITFKCSKRPVKDQTNEKVPDTFFDENPAKTPYKIPVGLQANGEVFTMPLTHTFVAGLTGSGKGSLVQAVIRQLIPYVQQERCELYGIDPKRSDVGIWNQSNLFKHIGETNEDAIHTINMVHRRMEQLQASKTTNLEQGDAGRDLPITKKTPLVVLLIDEIVSFIQAIKQQGREGKEALSKLNAILFMGRSANVFVIAATQVMDKEILGIARDQYQNRIALRQASEHFNDLLLGDGAAKNGYDARNIPMANKANGYATAGVGYSTNEHGETVKIRLAYTSDKDICQLILENPGEHQELTLNPEQLNNQLRELREQQEIDRYTKETEEIYGEEHNKNTTPTPEQGAATQPQQYPVIAPLTPLEPLEPLTPLHKQPEQNEPTNTATPFGGQDPFANFDQIKPLNDDENPDTRKTA